MFRALDSVPRKGGTREIPQILREIQTSRYLRYLDP